MTKSKLVLLLVIGLSLSSFLNVRAADPDMANGMNKTWVYRRNEAEKNGIDAIAIYVYLKPAAGDKIEGTLTIWTKRGMGGMANKYDSASKLKYTLPAVPVNNAGLANRKHESCRWDSTTLLPVPVGGAPPIKVYAAMFKGTNKGKGHEHRRLVLRCRKNIMADKAPVAAPCDEEPDDDVLQEETNPPDPPDYDDP
jgi:hypothetical protein